MSSYKKTIILGLDSSEYVTKIQEAKKENEGFKESLDEASESTEKFSEATDESSKSIEELKEKSVEAAADLATAAASVIALGKGIGESLSNTADFGKELSALSAQTGMNVESIQALQYASEQMGMSSNTVIDAMSKMTATMDKARDGSESLNTAFSRLKVRYTEHGNQLRDSQEVFVELIDALGKVPDAQERATLAMDLFGSSAQQLTPLIDQGTSSLYGLMDEAVQFGTIVSGETVAASAEFGKSLDAMNQKIDAMKVQLGSALIPVVETILNLLLKIPTPIYAVAGALTMIVTGVVAIIKAVEAFSKLNDILDMFGGKSYMVIAQILAITIALTALVAIIAILCGYGDQVNATMESVRSTSGVTQYNARGTDFFTGGETWVGENGPELVTLPRGSRITPAADSTTGSTNIYNVTIDAKNVREFNDIVRLAQHEQTSYRVGTVRV